MKYDKNIFFYYTMNAILLIGVSLVIMYIVTQVLQFYGVTSASYGKYIGFYLFMLVCILVLPHGYPKLKYDPTET
jgi:hypothetical protein